MANQGFTSCQLLTHLFSSLEDMNDEARKRFSLYLTDKTLEDFPPIPKARLESHKVTNIVEQMRDMYGIVDSLNITLFILKLMNYNDLARRLDQKIKETHLGGKEPESRILQNTIQSNKDVMMRKFEHISEVTMKGGTQIHLDSIYTELHITEGESEGVNEEHEIWQIENTDRRRRHDRKIKCNDIFKPLPGQRKTIRLVMTKGVAGIGKTVSVQKFVLDWAEGEANQDKDFMFVLPFRELNLIKDDRYSFHTLLIYCYPELQHLQAPEIQDVMYKKSRIVIILDGLDESRLLLHLPSKEKLCDALQESRVEILLSNLIQGNLLPSAFIWITTRPAAAKQVPEDYISQRTEIRGFTDKQKEEYFKKRIREDQAENIISHIKTSRSLYIMCHIPVFCSILVTVLEGMLVHDDLEEKPKTLTEVFIYFLLIQSKNKEKKYEGRNEVDREKVLESNKAILMKLAKLAFEELQEGKILFTEKDLQHSGIDVTDAAVHSGMCTEIFKEDAKFFKAKLYCFVHLSVQEFLAALYVFYCYVSRNMKALKCFISRTWRVSLANLLKAAVDQSVKSQNGHLDLFLRFLLGISLESNQSLLQGLLPKTKGRSKSLQKTSRHIKKTISNNEKDEPSKIFVLRVFKIKTTKNRISTERAMNLLLCLLEMKDASLHNEIDSYVKSGDKLSPAHCSALAYMILVSENVLDEFDMKKYNTDDEGREILIIAVRNSRKARLHGCKFTEESYKAIMSSLQLPNSHIREMDLSYSDLKDPEELMLCSALLCPSSRLENLSLKQCFLHHCDVLASVLSSGSSNLRHLDLSENDLLDSGVEILSTGVRSPHCTLETLGLSGCCISERGCEFLSSALSSNPSYLRELDLSYNHPGEAGVKLLTARLQDPHCKLEKLNVDHDDECWLKSGLQKYACKFTLDPNTANRKLLLSEGNRKVTCVVEKQPYPDHPERFKSWLQVLCREDVSGRCYWEVERSGQMVYIGVTYKGISRRGFSSDNYIGGNNKSWVLIYDNNSYSVRHNSISTAIPAPPSSYNRVGVYLDWSAGTLTFYSISSDKLTHLHTFHSTFTEPLYPGFGVLSYKSSLTLCEI
uniref:NACHT, LRR and PYD domains-containing protein 3-like n=1 Tax=Denticeps clupeoides TaxID=299321 RepID=A0AAY4BXK8_9TELE